MLHFFTSVGSSSLTFFLFCGVLPAFSGTLGLFVPLSPGGRTSRAALSRYYYSIIGIGL